jgi:nicotinamidase-related amidase
VPNKTALIIIDMQYCDAHPDYGLGIFLAAKHPALVDYYFGRLQTIVVPNIARLLNLFRKHSMRVAFICSGSDLPDMTDLDPRRRPRETSYGMGRGRMIFYREDPEYSVLEDLTPQEGELMLRKTTGGAFASTNIDQVLHNIGIENLVVTGVVTNSCVDLTAREAADRGYRCVIAEDGCATLNEASHEASLLNFARVYGHVRTTQEIIDDFASKLG